MKLKKGIPETKSISVIVIDNIPVYRDMMDEILHLVPFVENVFSTPTTIDGITKINKEHIDVIFINTTGLDKNGVMEVALLKQRFPEIKIIVLSLLTEEHLITEMIVLGVSEYLDIIVSKDEIIETLNNVISNKNYLSKNIANNLIQKIKKDAQLELKVVPVSHTEKLNEFMYLFSHEKSLKEIGYILCLSMSTVYHYLKEIMVKTKSRTHAGIVSYVFENKIYYSVYYKDKFAKHFLKDPNEDS